MKNKFESPDRPQQDGSLERPIIESRLDRDKEIQKITAEHPEAKDIMDRQELVVVKYLNKDNQFCQGQIFVDKDLVLDVQELFQYLLDIKFRVDKVVPIQDAQYGSEDDLSMRDNNSSGMNFRYIEGSKRLSLHAFGFAIDINPKDNPVEYSDGKTKPEGATRDLSDPEVFTADHEVVKWLESRGWEWGGHWEDPYHDNHHFQKPLATESYKKNLEFSLQNGYMTPEDYEKRLAVAEKNLANLNNEKV